MWLLCILTALLCSTNTASEHERRGARVLLRAGTIDITDAMMRSDTRARHATTLTSGERIDLRSPALFGRQRSVLSVGVAAWDVDGVHLEQWLVHVKSPVTAKTEADVNAVVAPYKLGSYVPHNTVCTPLQARLSHARLSMHASLCTPLNATTWTPHIPPPSQFLLVAPESVAVRARRLDLSCLLSPSSTLHSAFACSSIYTQYSYAALHPCFMCSTSTIP
jgi:hypothetical protein